MRFVKGSLSIKKEVPNKSFDHDNAIVTLFAGEWKQDNPSRRKKRANWRVAGQANVRFT